jgi:hypothetical protein
MALTTWSGWFGFWADRGDPQAIRFSRTPVLRLYERLIWDAGEIRVCAA